MSIAMPYLCRGAWRVPGAVAILMAALLAGCSDSIAPAPTGQLEGSGGGGVAPTQSIVNEVPRTQPGPPVVGRATGIAGTATPPAATTPQTVAPAASAATRSTGVGEKFYEVAATAGTSGPGGAVLLPDSRGEDAAATYAADHPPLATFDRSAATVLPVPDGKQPYQSIIDPAEGALPASARSINLAVSASEIENVRFSAPAHGQVIVASRGDTGVQRNATQLDRHDLARNKQVSRASLPDQAVLLDVSPDGTRALVRFTFGLSPAAQPVSTQTRLDVWELTEETGLHIVGWQPGAAEGRVGVPIGGAFLDGDRVVTLTDNGELTLWNLAEQKALYTVATGTRGPLLVTPGRKYVAVFNGTTFAAFEAATGTFRGTLTPPRPTLAACKSAAFSPDGTQLAAVLNRPAQSILSWNLSTGRPALELDAPLELARGLHFGDDNYLVAGGILFDTIQKKPSWIYVENVNNRNVAESPDQRHWIVTRPPFRDGTVLEAIQAPTEEVATAAKESGNLTPPLLRPGDALAIQLEVTGFNGDREAFEAGLARELARTLSERGLSLDPGATRALRITAESRRTGETIAFDTGDGTGAQNVPAHDIPFTLAVIDEREKSLWSGEGRVQPAYTLEKHPEKTLEQMLIESMWLSAPATIAATLDDSMPAYLRATPPEGTLGQTRLWAGASDISKPSSTLSNVAETTSPDDPIAALPARQPSTRVTISGTPSRDIAVLSAYNLVAATSDDGILRIGQMTPQSPVLRKIDEVRSPTPATRIALHPSGTWFAFGTEKGDIRAYDIERKRPSSGFSGASGIITALTFTSEPMLVAGTQGGRVYSWVESNPFSPTQIADGQAIVTGLAGVPYTNRVVIAWADGVAHLVDAANGQVVRNLKPDSGTIHGVAVSPDAQSALFATESGGVLVSLSGGTILGRFEEEAVTAVAFRPDGNQLATATRLGRIVLWQLSDMQPDSRLDGAGGQVDAIVFNGAGTAVAATVRGRREVPLWNLSVPGSPVRGTPSGTGSAAEPNVDPGRTGPGRGV